MSLTAVFNFESNNPVCISSSENLDTKEARQIFQEMNFWLKVNKKAYIISSFYCTEYCLYLAFIASTLHFSVLLTFSESVFQYLNM